MDTFSAKKAHALSSRKMCFLSTNVPLIPSGIRRGICTISRGSLAEFPGVLERFRRNEETSRQDCGISRSKVLLLGLCTYQGHDEDVVLIHMCTNVSFDLFAEIP